MRAVFYLKILRIKLLLMHVLLQTRFFQSLMTTVSTAVLPFNDLCILFDEFIRIVIERCDRGDLQSTLRMLSYTHARLELIREQFAEERLPRYITGFICQAERFLALEQRIIDYKFRYPEYFISNVSPISSPLFWSGQYHAINLSEILCGFDRMIPKPVILADGRDAPFNLVVRVFENTLNIKLGDPSDIKRRVLDRKKDRTKFTETMLYALNRED